MTILFDIGHPGHVHYFKKSILELKKNNHQVIVTARERDIIFYLLDYYKIPYINRGKGSNSKIGKLLYMLKADFFMIRKLIFRKPDLFISFSSPYAAQAAYILRRPHIAVNDTEHTDEIHSKFTYKFSKWIITPKSYQNNLGKKHVRFNNIMEGIYLDKKVFKPKIEVLNELNIDENTPYVFIRFVSWNAHHDFGQSGLTLETKRKLVNLLSKKYKIFISSEDELPDEFSKYKLDVKPENIHSVLYNSSLFVGESGTMASESAYLGVHTVYINSLPLMCYLKLEQEYGILKHFKSSDGVLDYIAKVIVDKNLESANRQKADKMKNTFSEVTSYFTSFIENYPPNIK